MTLKPRELEGRAQEHTAGEARSHTRGVQLQSLIPCTRLHCFSRRSLASLFSYKMTITYKLISQEDRKAWPLRNHFYLLCVSLSVYLALALYGKVSWFSHFNCVKGS